MMSHAKDPDLRQRRNMPTVLAADGTPVYPVLAVPRPPTGLSARLRKSWAGLWDSPASQVLDPVSDLPAVARLFDIYKLGEQLDALLKQAHPDAATRKALAAADPDEDQQELIAAHVAARQAFNSTVNARMRVATEARQLEAQLGLSPRARLALGLALLAGRNAAGADSGRVHDDADD
jgi:hypothetical protein